jgi:hypothetical protein
MDKDPGVAQCSGRRTGFLVKADGPKCRMVLNRECELLLGKLYC